MAIDLETLLKPIDGEDPAGPDMAYDPQRTEIEQAFERTVSGDPTGGSSAGPDIDWRPIINAIEAQSQKTKDIWLAVYLCRAGARSGRLDVMVQGAQFLAGLIENYWADMHPKLDELGFQGRKGACDSLTSTPESIGDFVGALMRVPLLIHPRLGSYSSADFQRFLTGAEAEDGYGMFRAALEDTPEESLAEIAAQVEAAKAAFKTADALLMEHSEGESSTNFKGAYDAFDQMKQSVLAFAKSPPEESEEGEAEGEMVSDGPARGGGGGGGGGIGGRVESREDVIKVLDSIGDYYRRKEPASPVPVILLRVRDWVMADFLTLMEDIAPGSLDEAKRLLVSQREN